MFRSLSTAVLVPLLAVSAAPNGAWAKQAAFNVALAHPTILAGGPQTTYLMVGLTGFESSPAKKRPNVNVALVVDKSGSMGGSKIEQARNAAIRALDRLDAGDVVSVIAFDTEVQIVVPATKFTDPEHVRRAILAIQPGGNTALFAGVSKGVAEVRKFMDRQSVNRVILLSDGLANVGPSSPSALGELGASLMKERIAVSTLGLGLDFNEDLMVELARRSDGNHVFVEEATELASVFNREFNDVLSVVAQEVTIIIHCAPGIQPVRLLGIGGEINGQDVFVRLNQLYSNQEKYALLEVTVPESGAVQSRPIATIEASYLNLETGGRDRLTSAISVQFDDSPAIVQERTNPRVMTESVLQIANLKNEEAVKLRDEGKIAEAKAVLNSNAYFLRDNAQLYKAPKLEQRALDNASQSKTLEDQKEWTRTRKDMRSKQHEDARQQQSIPQGPTK